MASFNDLLLASIGGLLISLSSSLNLLIMGRITGMSGTLNGIITLDKKSFHWKSSLFFGIFFVASLFAAFLNGKYNFKKTKNTLNYSR